MRPHSSRDRAAAGLDGVMVTATSHDSYVTAIIGRLWDFAEGNFGENMEVLERPSRSTRRPPVFVRGAVQPNLLYPPDGGPALRQAILGVLPASARHRHFGSTRSSQALAQSVFGALIVLDKLHILADLSSEGGLPAFCEGVMREQTRLDSAIDYLGEPRPTSVDVWLEGRKRIAVECKLTESEFGRCSRPNLRPGRDTNYERDPLRWYLHATATADHSVLALRDRCSLLGVDPEVVRLADRTRPTPVPSERNLPTGP